MINEIIQGPALENLQRLEADSIDLIVTDPPYGYSFMNKDWDKAVVSADTWRQCLRVLKPGAFAFIMSSPRQDVFCKMMLNLIEAGFRTDFSSIYWAYASGFPKAADISKLVDKQNDRNYNPEFREYINNKRLEKGLTFKDINEYLGYSVKGGKFASDLLGDKLNHRYLFPSLEVYLKLKTFLDLDNRFDELVEREEAEREILGKRNDSVSNPKSSVHLLAENSKKEIDITKPATEQAKQLEGSYAGFQPKPAVELILVVMKPLSEKSYVDQALANKKGITWLDDCRIPYQSEQDKQSTDHDAYGIPDIRGGNYGNNNDRLNKQIKYEPPDKGRFPANLCVSDNILDTVNEVSKNDTYLLLDEYLSSYHWLTVDSVVKSFNPNLMMSSGDLVDFVVETADPRATGKKVKPMQSDILTQWLEDGIEYGVKGEAEDSTTNLNIDGYGNNIMEQYQKVIISTIRTETKLTIRLKTSNSSLVMNINLSTQGNEKIIRLLTESKLESVSVVNNTNLLLSFTHDQRVLIMDIVNHVVKNTLENGKQKQTIKKDDNFSRYFSLDAWAKTLPFLLVPKPAKSEKGEFNSHPTVKSLKLMSYLITMGSREADTVLDPFCGSGTVLIAAHELHRKYLGIEISQEYCDIARERLRPHKEQKRIQEFTETNA